MLALADPLPEEEKEVTGSLLDKKEKLSDCSSVGKKTEKDWIVKARCLKIGYEGAKGCDCIPLV